MPLNQFRASQLVVFLSFFSVLLPVFSSAWALACGIALSLGFGLQPSETTKKASAYLLQISIVLLGFSMRPDIVWQSGKAAVLITLVTISATIGFGCLLAKLLRLSGALPMLISVGTAICGGSAIAAVSPVLRAKTQETSFALAVVFILNGVALFIFPPAARFLNLSPEQFGQFAALAIHDTSSVVGAAAAFAQESLETAVTMKLTRALWIIPLTIVFSLMVTGEDGRKKIAKPPFFIILFLAAVMVRALFPSAVWYSTCETMGKMFLKGAIFLWALQLDRASVLEAGFRPFLMGIILWAFVIAQSIGILYLL